MRPRLRGLGAAALALCGVWVAPQTASAFCRTTTCDPRDECEYDRDTGCAVNGLPLRWGSACVSFAVQQQGSPANSITFEQADSVIRGAFHQWVSARCEGGAPALDVVDFGAVECGTAEYNEARDEHGNANLWVFRDDGWPYEESGDDVGSIPSSTLALTSVTYNPTTGEIYDADVEVNSYKTEITVGDERVRFDLGSIATHEAGHFLGLSHTAVPFSTMNAGYLPGTTSLRDLGDDDIAGICAAYPPGRATEGDSCSPRHGFASDCADEPGCSCSVVGGGPHRALGPLMGALLAGGASWARRRRRVARLG